MQPTPFELKQLKCFVAVAEELSFRRAAARLGMTQPPLSRQIALLEHTIGLKLFDRGNRAVRLTPAGRSLQASAADLLQRADAAVLAARQAARGEAGAVAMGFVPSAALEFVPRIVAALRRDLPAVTFSPTEMMSYEIMAALISGQLDLGLTRMPGRQSDLESYTVVNEPFVLALPGDHPLAARSKATLADIDGEGFVGYSTERGGFLREVQTALFATEGIEPRTLQEVSQTHTVLALVNSGLGVALVPRSARVMRMPNLAYRDVETPAQFRSTLYLHVGRRMPERLRDRAKDAILTALAEFRGAAG